MLACWRVIFCQIAASPRQRSESKSKSESLRALFPWKKHFLELEDDLIDGTTEGIVFCIVGVSPSPSLDVELADTLPLIETLPTKDSSGEVL